MIIPKPGKPAYNTPKAFRPIVADTSLSLTTTMVNSKILNKSIKSPTLPPGLQDSSKGIGESLDSLNLLSRTSSRAGK